MVLPIYRADVRPSAVVWSGKLPEQFSRITRFNALAVSPSGPHSGFSGAAGVLPPGSAELPLHLLRA
jgi:hypothetical protein